MKKQNNLLEKDHYRYQPKRNSLNIIDILHESLQAELLPAKKQRKRITAQPSAETAATKQIQQPELLVTNRTYRNTLFRNFPSTIDHSSPTVRMGGKRARQLIEIQQSNYRLLKKLRQQPQSQYSVARMRRDWNKNKELINSICEYPFQLDKRPKSMMTARRSHSRKKSGFSINKIYRISNDCVVDGRHFHVTVILNHLGLSLIGTCDQLDSQKIIKVDRGEALDLLKNQCDNRLEGLLDKLRFDGETLYLVNNSENAEKIQQLEKEQELNLRINLAQMKKRLERAQSQCSSRNGRRAKTKKLMQSGEDILL